MFERARLRLALWYAGVFTAILVALGITAYSVMRDQLDDEIDRSLEESVAGLSLMGNHELRGNFGPPRGGFGPDRDQDLSTDVFFVVLETDGAVANNPRDLAVDEFPVEELVATSAGQERAATFTAGGEHFRTVSTYIDPRDGDPVTLVVGRSLGARDYQLRMLAIVLAGGGIAGLALATVGGFILAGRALVPIRTSLETQRKFVSDASHELRTPIAVVKANAELLLRHPGQTIEANVDQIEAINEEADHLTRLVGDLLTLARADEQRLQVIRQRFELDQVVESVVRDMEAVAKANGVALNSDLAAGEIDADPQRLRQLTTILLDNALKFTPSGGRVAVRSFRQGSRWLLSVSDTGPGISVEAQQHVFDRFYRADESRAPQTGTGLGLAIARWITEAHQGRISLDSTPGKGSTFTVTLPASH